MFTEWVDGYRRPTGSSPIDALPRLTRAVDATPALPYSDVSS
jgi:hypothetical protein